MKEPNDILRYISIQLAEVKQIIEDSADLNEIAYDKLYDLDKNPFTDWEDRENYEYYLARYKTLIEIMDYTKKDD